MNEGGESHGGPLSDAEETEIEGGTRLQGLSEETISILTEKRHQLESHIIGTFNGNEMWFQETRLQFKGVPHITTDEWEVTIRFNSESFRTILMDAC